MVLSNLCKNNLIGVEVLKNSTTGRAMRVSLAEITPGIIFEGGGGGKRKSRRAKLGLRIMDSRNHFMFQDQSLEKGLVQGRIAKHFFFMSENHLQTRNKFDN